MKRLSEQPEESRKPLTRFYGIMAKESGLLPLKTDRSTRTQRTTLNGGLSLPCSSSALMNSHTPKLNNRRHIERHTKTGNHKKVSCFFAFIFGVFEKPPYCPTKRETWHALCLAVFNFRWCGEWKENEGKFPQITVIFALRGVVGSRGRNTAAELAKSPPCPSRVSENSMRYFRRNATNQPPIAG